MKGLKKVLLSIIATLPLGAISYAADYERNVEVPDVGDLAVEFEDELLQFSLPNKYYDYMENNMIFNLDDLNAEKNYRHFERMLRHYEFDKKYGVAASGGAISIGGTF